MRKTLLLIPLALALAGCGGGSYATQVAQKSTRSCPKAWHASWQRLANKIDAPVYCPSWIPDPLTGQIGGRWNNIDSVSRGPQLPDRLRLAGEERGDPHQSARLSGRDEDPELPQHRARRRQEARHVRSVLRRLPRREDTRRLPGDTYTVNQDADQWHLLYAWRHGGTLYTLSEHIAPPYTLPRIVQNMNRMMGSLVLVQPR